MNNCWPKEDKLRTHLAENMLKCGKIVEKVHKENQYCSMDKYEIKYRGATWEIVFVDGMACQINRV